LIGNAGTGKSVILKFVHDITPRSKFVSGKSTSTAGLIGGAVKDEFSGSWGIEAGAMAMSNGSIICVDEMEKISEDDRSSMHQAMEQQEVSINKVSIQCTLRTETAVLAAANPKYSNFKEDMDLAKQINLPPTLLSRFDAIFILRDTPNDKKDLMIASKILMEHMSTDADVIDSSLLKKYIIYANQFKPKLTFNASVILQDFYLKMRKINNSKESIAITARQLEGMIRFAEAHAKMRLSQTVDEVDATVSTEIMKDYLEKMGYDAETNTFDVNKLKGVSGNKLDKLALVMKTIINMKPTNGAYIKSEDLLVELSKTSFKVDEFDKYIYELKRSGDIFEPKPNTYCAVI
jgi:replicative DNA helicase Mcm